MLQKNKKALSEIVGYTLLIVIALSLSIMVYSFLKVYVPKETVSCKEDTVIILQDYGCSAQTKELNLTLLNKGLFKVDAAYVRFGNATQKIKTQINENSFLMYGPENVPGLNPGESFFSSYSSNLITSPGEYGLEIQPVIIMDKKLVVCEKGLITQLIQCV